MRGEKRAQDGALLLFKLARPDAKGLHLRSRHLTVHAVRRQALREAQESQRVLNGKRRSVLVARVTRAVGILERRLWTQSVCMGIGSSAVARRTRLASPEEAFVAGLLADSGQAVLLELLRGDYQGLLLTAYREDVDILELEREHFGVGHDEIGAALARRWNLPESLEQTIRQHHGCPSGETDPRASGMAHVVQAAVLLARAVGAGRPAPAPGDPDAIAAKMGALGLDPGAFDLLAEEVRTRLQQEGPVFG